MDEFRTRIIVNGLDTDLHGEHTHTFACIELAEMESNLNETAAKNNYSESFSLIKCVAEIKL